MTILHAVLLGFLGGSLTATGIVIGVQARSKRLSNIEASQIDGLQEIIKLNSHLESQKVEVQKNLTAPDLLEVACSNEYLDKHGDLLCRELFCRLQTRQGDGASQQECESMANISNSQQILSSCTESNEVPWEECIDLFEKRK